MNYKDLQGKKIILTSKVEFDVERDTDWIEIIKDRIGEEEFSEEQLMIFLFENNYLDVETDFRPNSKIEIK